MVTLMKSLWSPDPFFRPQAKDLDMALMDMNMRDAEPIVPGDQKAKPTTKEMLYQLFPKHIADALLAGQKVEPEQHDLVTGTLQWLLPMFEWQRYLTVHSGFWCCLLHSCLC